MNPANWGAAALGAMAGLGGGLVLFVVLGLLGVVGAGKSTAPLIFVQYLALLAAGYVGGRFGRPAPLRTGARASLLLFVVSAAITLAISAARPSVLELALAAVVAAVLGYAGGALAGWRPGAIPPSGGGGG